MADLIPNDVLFDQIFVRLPVKSLLNCKCVCKTWNNVITDPDFARKHLRFCQRQHVLLQLQQHDYISVDIGTGYTHKIKINKVIQHMEIIGTSNGLVCGLVVALDQKALQIWNPLTGDSKLVSKGPSLRIHHMDIVRFAFCYDSLQHDFKIVYLNPKKSGRTKKVKFDIYSLKSDSWKIIRECDGISNLEGIVCNKRGYDVNGNIYWIVPKRVFFDILVFNVRDNKFRKLQLPQGCKPKPDYYTDLRVMNSSLCLYQYPSQDKNKSISLWKLNEIEEWIHLMYITRPFSLPKYVNLRPICLTESNKVVLVSSQLFDSRNVARYNTSFYDCTWKTDLILYDEVTNGIRNLNICRISHGIHPIMQEEVYVESLVSPHTITRYDDVPKKKRRRRSDDNTNKKGKSAE